MLQSSLRPTGNASVAELADAPDLGSGSRKGMGVRPSPFAPENRLASQTFCYSGGRRFEYPARFPRSRMDTRTTKPSRPRAGRWVIPLLGDVFPRDPAGVVRQ